MTDTLNIQEYLQDNLPNYLDILHRMVNINSFTVNPAGVNDLSKLTADVFAPLGFQAELIQSTNPNYGRHLFLKRSGAGETSKAIAFGLVSHLDTVFSSAEELQNDFSWRIREDRIYGPGALDIKGGTVMIYMVLNALRTFAPQAFEKISWLICLDASEETLSEDFADQCLTHMAGNTKACLVFEGGTNTGSTIPIVVARKGRATFRVEVQGKSAHAGNAHSQGANAILQITHTIQQISDFTNYQQQITFNVGTISGGSVVNRVPHYAEATVEMRAFSPEVFNDGYQKMVSLNGSSQVSSSDGYPCHVSIRPLEQTAPWPRNPATDNLLGIWDRAAEGLGSRTTPEERGGLSDGNLLWNHFPTLDGLGPAGANAHCSERSADGSKDQEYVKISSFVPKAMLNILAILSLIDGG